MTTSTDKFDRLLHLEQVVRLTGLSQQFSGTGTPDFVKERSHLGHESDKRRLFDLLDSLTPDELVQFGEYRTTHR